MEQRLSLEEITRLAEGGDPVWQERLGEEYIHGNFGPKDDDLAWKYSKMAADQGSARAMTNLGIVCQHRAEKEEARKWFAAAAEKGDMKAPRYLGQMAMAEGKPAEAREAYLLGADRGDISSQYELGVIYEQGLGVEKDMDEAIRWYRISAQRGDKIAKPAMDALERLGVK